MSEKMIKVMRSSAIIFLAAALSLSACSSRKSYDTSGGAVSSAASDTEPVSATVFAMDTYMTITAYGSGAKKATDEAAEKIKELEALWNVNDENSDISRVNKHGSAEVNSVTAELLRFALGKCRDTGGALDITLYPVLREWGFTTGEYHIPDSTVISALLADTGAERVNISGNTVSVPEGFMLDLGSVAKGSTGDIIAGIMRDNGVKSALLDLGGNIQTVGAKPDGSKWKIGLKDPRGEGLFGVIEAEDLAVVTSGGYERYFEQDGEVYWHILDPKTGCPARSGLISAAVAGSEGKLCDALSTALFVMGEEKAVDYWRSNGGFEFVLVTEDGRVLVSEGLEDCYNSKGIYSDTEVIRRGEK